MLSKNISILVNGTSQNLTIYKEETATKILHRLGLGLSGHVLYRGDIALSPTDHVYNFVLNGDHSLKAVSKVTELHNELAAPGIAVPPAGTPQRRAAR